LSQAADGRTHPGPAEILSSLDGTPVGLLISTKHLLPALVLSSQTIP
jgi:hypothetical protein